MLPFYQPALAECWSAVFAALFSAVSTAFLIESSGMLKQDPNDVSAAALVAISQALGVLTNSSLTNQTQSTPTKQNVTTLFDPSNTAVIVNALWYLSLSLSIATSFLAMLAKDWCHSFASNRTGHAWDQAHRRQRKWIMIERWKMQELIVILPSLIYLSLLLFAIGLCFYVWDLHQTTAIPVICVARAAFAFYVWSSITASTVEFFPYTTVVSRILLSEFASLQHQNACKLAMLASTAIHAILSKLGILAKLVGSSILYLIKFLVVAFVRLALKLLYFLTIVLCARWVFFGAFDIGSGTIPPLLALDMMCSGLTKKITETMERKTADFVGTTGSIGDAKVRFIIKLTQSKESSVTQDHITSLALRWLIQHCETPNSVAIALQAIAGASHRIPRQPLILCQATLQILRRLVASSPDIGVTSDTYVRALKVLGSHPLLGPGNKESGHTDDIEVLIWDLKSAHEKQIVDLIQDMEFIPTEDNLTALSIGNAAASHGLRLLKGGGKNAAKTMTRIHVLLKKHMGSGVDSKHLHPAAFQSIINAAVLMASCSTNSPLSSALVELCMKYCNNLCIGQDSQPLKTDMGSGNTVGLAICVLLHRRQRVNSASQLVLNVNACVQGVAHALMDSYFGGQAYQQKLFWAVCLESLSHSDWTGFSSRADEYWPLKKWCEACLPEFISQLSDAQLPMGDEDSIRNQNFAFLKAINQVYDIAGLSAPHDFSGSTTPANFATKALPAPLYVIAARVTCLARSDVQQTLGKRLFSNFCFPKLSFELVGYLEDRSSVGGAPTPGLISLLSTTFKNAKSNLRARHFATTQLWLLLHLAGDSSTNNQIWLWRGLEADSILDIKKRA
ncbi:unnamed protein product [Rhizoctonia solani]|uniref:DUF6535 domain-containing protein n=1 Tax=Rhizoctonia solani TaxID=456999 RepID=A0A8H3HF84_9AGAM|nr:unnamed protein product [Rhizoctonia solani]